MSNRKTFFTIEVPGPTLPFSAVCAAQPGTEESRRLFRLYERASTIQAFHRPGHWSVSALQRFAARRGGVLRSAESIARDDKGFLEGSVRVIYPAEA